MPNATTTHLDAGALLLQGESFRHDELLTFGGAATVKAGAILARDSSTGKLVPYLVGGTTNGNGIPKYVLMHEVVATGVGDKPCSVLARGRVVRRRLVINADGDATNLTPAIVDMLRDYGIHAEEVAQLGKHDNTTP
jgi:hypothetical protein